MNNIPEFVIGGIGGIALLVLAGRLLSNPSTPKPKPKYGFTSSSALADPEPDPLRTSNVTSVGGKKNKTKRKK
jgi:hypothetical protein